MNWKLLAAAVLMLVGVGAAVFVVVRPDLGATATSQYLTAAVTREDVAKNATASGTLSPHGIYGLAFGADPAPLSSTSTTSSGSSAASSGSGSGGTTWVVKTVATKVGDTVKAGQVLATADTSDAKLQVVIAQANLAAAKARLTVDQGGSQALVVAAARNQLAQSQLAYTTAQHTRQSTIQQNADAVTQAEQALTDAQAQLTTAKAGPTADVVTAAQDALAQAQLQYQSAVQAVAAQRTQNSQTVSQASDALTAAQDQLASAQAKMNIDQLALNNATAKLMTDTADKTTDPAVLAADQQAVTQATSAVNADQQAMTQAQAAITSAQNNLDATNTKVTGSGDQLDTQLTQAQQALTSAQHQYAAKIAPSQTSIDAANQAVQQAEQNLLVAKQKQASGVTQLADQLAQAQLQLAGAQNSYQQKIAPAAADQLASDKASIAQAEVNLASARNTLAHSVIVAPIDGTIVAVNIVPGVQAPSGYAITMLSGPFQVAADFTESDITTLAVGQPATVSISATGETAQGTVTQITPVAATSAGSSVVTYAVIVVLDPTPTSAMSGMSANVSITTASSPNTLAVPATAVVGRNGNYEVRVLDQAGQVSLVPVQIGLATNSLIEITSGLSEGETVVTGTSSTRQGTTATAGGGFGFPGLGGGGGEFRQRVGNGTNAGANGGAGAQTAPQP